MEINTENKIARVVVPDNQLSLSIGREGQNVRLAAKITGWKVDILSESQIAELSKPEEPAEEETTVVEEEGTEDVYKRQNKSCPPRGTRNTR